MMLAAGPFSLATIAMRSGGLAPASAQGCATDPNLRGFPIASPDQLLHEFHLRRAVEVRIRQRRLGPRPLRLRVEIALKPEMKKALDIGFQRDAVPDRRRDAALDGAGKLRRLFGKLLRHPRAHLLLEALARRL